MKRKFAFVLVALIFPLLSGIGCGKAKEATTTPEVNSLKLEIQRLDEKASRLEADCVAKDAMIANLKLQLSDANNQVADLRAKLDAGKSGSVLTAGLRDQVAMLEKENAILRDENNKLKIGSTTNPDMEAELAKLREELKDAKDLLFKVKDGNLVVVMEDKVFFKTLSADLSEKGQDTLSKVAKVLNEKFGANKIRIDGHADSRPIKGSKIFPTNWELSAARAISALKHLEAQGVNPEKMVAAGYSYHSPVAANDTEENRAKNRRVEITIMR